MRITNHYSVHAEDEGERGAEERGGSGAEPVDAVGVRPVERDLVSVDDGAELGALAEERQQQRGAERPRVAPHERQRRQQHARRKAAADQHSAEQQHGDRRPEREPVVQRRVLCCPAAAAGAVSSCPVFCAAGALAASKDHLDVAIARDASFHVVLVISTTIAITVIKIVVSILIIVVVVTIAGKSVVVAAGVAAGGRGCGVLGTVGVKLAVEGVDAGEGVGERGAELLGAGGLAAGRLGVEVLERLEEERDKAGDVDAEVAVLVAADGGGHDGLELLRDEAHARGVVAAVAERAAAEAQHAVERAADRRDVGLEARVRALQEAALRKDLAAHVQPRELGRHVHDAHNVVRVQRVRRLLAPHPVHHRHLSCSCRCCCHRCRCCCCCCCCCDWHQVVV